MEHVLRRVSCKEITQRSALPLVTTFSIPVNSSLIRKFLTFRKIIYFAVCFPSFFFETYCFSSVARAHKRMITDSQIISEKFFFFSLFNSIVRKFLVSSIAWFHLNFFQARGGWNDARIKCESNEWMIFNEKCFKRRTITRGSNGRGCFSAYSSRILYALLLPLYMHAFCLCVIFSFIFMGRSAWRKWSDKLAGERGRERGML